MIDPGTSFLFCFLHDFKCSTWQWGGLGKLYGSTIVSSHLVSRLFSNMREKFFVAYADDSSAIIIGDTDHKIQPELMYQ